MRIHLVVVPPGGGEAEYTLSMECPAIPQVGDYITVLRDYKQGPPSDDYLGSEDFKVRRTWWNFSFPDDGKMAHTAGQEPVGQVTSISVECEIAISAFSSKAHIRSGKGKAAEFDESMY